MHYLTLVAVDIPPYEEDVEENKRVATSIMMTEKVIGDSDVMRDFTLECLKERDATFKRLVGDAVEEYLEPFGQESEEYYEFIDMTEEIQHDYETGKRDYYKTPDGKFIPSMRRLGEHQFIVRGNLVYEYKNRKEVRSKLAKKMKAYPDYPNKKACKTIKEFAEDVRFENFDEEHDAYGYSCNPNAVYDWYVIGGRWFDCLLVKDSCVEVFACEKERDKDIKPPVGYKWVCGARMKDIEWDLMLNLYKEYLEKRYVEYKEWFQKGELPEKSSYKLMENGISSWNGFEYIDGDTLETFLKRKGVAPDVKYPPVCYGYFHDGMYHERWCYIPSKGSADELDESDWQKEVGKYLDELNPDDVLVGVDIHM